MMSEVHEQWLILECAGLPVFDHEMKYDRRKVTGMLLGVGVSIAYCEGRGEKNSGRHRRVLPYPYMCGDHSLKAIISTNQDQS